MQGFCYRRAVAIKEFGERKKIRTLVIIGLWLRDKILRAHSNTKKAIGGNYGSPAQAQRGQN